MNRKEQGPSNGKYSFHESVGIRQNVGCAQVGAERTQTICGEEIVETMEKVDFSTVGQSHRLRALATC
jgi:hypothetical protein